MGAYDFSKPEWAWIRHLWTEEMTSNSVPEGQREGLPKEPENDELSNNIHPLFRMENWLEISDEDYERLVPALRLASLMIEEKSLLGWWTHLLHGELKYCPRGANDRLEPYLAETAKEKTDQAVDETKAMFLKLSKILKWGFLDFRRYAKQEGWHPALAMTWSWSETLEEIKRGEKHAVKTSRPISPRTMFDIQWLERLRQPHSQSQVVREREYFFLATILCHELAHSFYVFKIGRPGYEPLTRPDEEMYRCVPPDYDPSPELGISVECSITGTSFVYMPLYQIGKSFLFYHPRFIMPKNVNYTSNIKLNQMRRFNRNVPVPSWFIHLWFRKSIWQDFGKLKKLGLLDPPTAEEVGYEFHWQIPEGYEIEWDGPKDEPFPGHWNLHFNGTKVLDGCKVWDMRRPRPLF